VPVTSLDPRFVALQRETGWYFSAAMSIGLAVGLTLLFGRRYWYVALAAWFVASLAIAWFSYRWAELSYRFVSYRVDEDGIEIREGVWWREVSNIPRSRVQHIDVSQGPLERKYGLGTLVIYTAGTAHSRTQLPGLAHQTALDLRNQLLPRIAPDAV
jgi:membrane protein YdbS with pleckstrin-like domain